jgi:hypothetical protein
MGAAIRGEIRLSPTLTSRTLEVLDYPWSWLVSVRRGLSSRAVFAPWAIGWTLLCAFGIEAMVVDATVLRAIVVTVLLTASWLFLIDPPQRGAKAEIESRLVTLGKWTFIVMLIADLAYALERSGLRPG